MSFQRPSKDVTTWKTWTAHDHIAAAHVLWQMAIVEFVPGGKTVQVQGLLTEAQVHIVRAEVLMAQNRLAASGEQAAEFPAQRGDVPH